MKELHKLLGIRKAFTHWFNYQCKRLNWVEDKHFILLANIGKQTDRGGHNKNDYIVSLDTGKSICIMTQGVNAQKVYQKFLEAGKKV